MNSYKVVVIGAGPAGGACAARCAKSGLKTAMVEDYGFGGTCPLRGCNPKKILTLAASLVAQAGAMQGKGLEGVPKINWADLAGFRDEFVLGKKESIEKAYQDLGIDTYNGQARFIDEYQVQVGRNILKGEYFVLATGIKPAPLKVPGEELISTSDQFLALDSLPQRICFVGGGYISFEFASVAARAGASPVIIHRSDRVLRGFDPDLSTGLVEALRDAGVVIHLSSPLKSVTARNKELTVAAGTSGREIAVNADMVVHGAGRIPDIDALNLEKTGVSASRSGIKVNQHMQSITNPRFFAVGDVADTPFALTPTGDMEGRTAADNIISPGSSTCRHHGIPRVVFSSPSLCAVGILQEEAETLGIRLRVVQEDISRWFSWANSGQKFARCKILVDEDRDIIIGAHILGQGADELANMFAMAVRMKLPVQELRDVLWAYPTMGYYFKYMLG